jgi:hypothetical protein
MTEEEIDEAVEAQAEDDGAWEKPVKARPPRSAAFELPSELAARAAFFARLHRTPAVEEWLTRVVRERIEMEEAAFAELKRDLAAG